MATTANSKAESDDRRAEYFVKPQQVESMRNATVAESAGYLSQRNDAIIQVLYDTGLRVGELVALDVDMVDLDDEVFRLPPHIQKQPPQGSGPNPVTMSLAGETVRVLRQYLNTRWKDSEALFPSRQAARMTTESVRNVVSRAAEAAEVSPYSMDGRGEPADVSPHTLRHSVAWRMMNREEGNSLYDVRNRLRHSSISTTEEVYDHWEEV